MRRHQAEKAHGHADNRGHARRAGQDRQPSIQGAGHLPRSSIGHWYQGTATRRFQRSRGHRMTLQEKETAEDAVISITRLLSRC